MIFPVQTELFWHGRLGGNLKPSVSGSIPEHTPVPTAAATAAWGKGKAARTSQWKGL